MIPNKALFSSFNISIIWVSLLAQPVEHTPPTSIISFLMVDMKLPIKFLFSASSAISWIISQTLTANSQINIFKKLY